MKAQFKRVGNIFFLIDLNPTTFAATFTKQTTRMIRKFAMLATTAALFVACGSNVEENAASTMDAAKDSATEMLNKAQEDAKAAASAVDSTAGAVVDSAKQAVSNTVDAAANAAAKTADKAAEAAKTVTK